MKKKMIIDSWSLLMKSLTKDQLKGMAVFSSQIEKEMKEIIAHYVSIDNSLVKIKKEFNFMIPLDYKFQLKKFKKGSSYRVIFWRVEDGNIRVSSEDLWEKINSGDEWNMFGGKEGLSILRHLVPEKLPKHKKIFSFKSTKGRDIPGLIMENNEEFESCLILLDRKIPIGSIVLSFERISEDR